MGANKRAHTSTAAATCIVALLFAGAARAEDIAVKWQQTNVAAGYCATEGPSSFACGYLPKLATDGVSDTTLIYQIATGFGEFQYMNGGLYSTLFWDEPQPVFSADQPDFEVGHSPSIAMVDCIPTSPCGTGVDVVQIHQGGQDDGAALWYRTGVTDNASVSWTNWADSQRLGDGFNPVIALDQQARTATGTTVVEVHQADSGLSELWYRVGFLTFSSATVNISWGAAHDTGLEGYAPTVTVQGGVVVLMAGGSSLELWYTLGVVDTSTKTISGGSWGTATNYDTGFNPSVTMASCSATSAFSCSGWVLVEAHQGGKGTGSLFYRTGTLNRTSPSSITWTPNSDTKYATGCYPAVANMTLGGIQIVEAHSTACGTTADLKSGWGILQ